jgi:hypothetical protein
MLAAGFAAIRAGAQYFKGLGFGVAVAVVVDAGHNLLAGQIDGDEHCLAIESGNAATLMAQAFTIQGLWTAAGTLAGGAPKTDRFAAAHDNSR